MKLFSYMKLLVLSANVCIGQTVYTVSPGTKGNTIELTVVHQSGAEVAGNVRVSVIRHSANVAFPSTERFIGHMPPGEQGVVIFPFDVARSAPVNGKDTIELGITDGRSLWMKSIVIHYTGPTTFSLEQNYPNPFNPVTTIDYQLPVASHVSLKVYDVLGREVETLIDEQQEAGYKTVQLNAGRVASGVYFFRLTAQPVQGGAAFSQVKKLMVMK